MYGGKSLVRDLKQTCARVHSTGLFRHLARMTFCRIDELLYFVSASSTVGTPASKSPLQMGGPDGEVDLG